MKTTAKIFDIVSFALAIVSIVLAIGALSFLQNQLVESVTKYIETSKTVLPEGMTAQALATALVKTFGVTYLIFGIVATALAIPAMIVVFKGGSSKAPHIMMIISSVLIGGVLGIVGGILGLVYLHNNETF